MMAEYARYYGGPPAATLKWPLFLALVERTGRFEARSILSQMDAVQSAIGASFSANGAVSEADRTRQRLRERAYPTANQLGSGWLPNLAAGESGEGDDG